MPCSEKTTQIRLLLAIKYCLMLEILVSKWSLLFDFPLHEAEFWFLHKSGVLPLVICFSQSPLLGQSSFYPALVAIILAPSWTLPSMPKKLLPKHLLLPFSTRDDVLRTILLHSNPRVHLVVDCAQYVDKEWSASIIPNDVRLHLGYYILLGRAFCINLLTAKKLGFRSNHDS